MNENKQVKLTSNHQLFDIHGALKNFKTIFSIQSDSPFDFAIVNQTQLDNDEIVFNKINSSITNTFQYLDNAFQNFFICLKSDNGATVNLAYQTEEIVPQQTMDVPMNHNMHMMEMNEVHPQEGSSNKSFYRTIWFKIFVISIIVMVVIYLYNNYKKSTESNLFKLSDKIPEAPSTIAAPVVASTPVVDAVSVAAPLPQPVPSISVEQPKPTFRVMPDVRQQFVPPTKPSLNYQEFATRLSKRLSGI